MPIGFPLLKVIIKQPNKPDYYKITWSNYHKQVSANPGVFKLSYITYKLPAKYLNDELSRRRDNPKKIEVEAWKTSFERIEPFTDALVKRFKEDLAQEIQDAFFTNSTFRKFRK